MRLIFYVLMCLIFFSSCSNKEADNLRNKISRELIIETQNKKDQDYVSILRYKELEKSFNASYINKLENTVSSNFEKSLEKFEDEELGFFSNYGYMFSYIFTSKEKWEDMFRIKSNKYFNTLELKGLLLNEYRIHLKNVITLRKQFATQPKQKNQFLPVIANIDIDDKDTVYLGELRDHSRNNIIIEIGTSVFVWLFVMFIISIITIFVGGIIPPAWLLTLLTIIASVCLSMYNDNNLLRSLREQNNNNLDYNYQSFLKEMNANTDLFYDKFNK